MKRIVFLTFLAAGLSACGPHQTIFRGEPHFTGGPAACASRCQAENMEMSAFVYSGEFATSCVCRSPAGPEAAPAQPPSAQTSSSEGEEVAVSAALVQRRQQEEAARRRRSNNRK